MSDAQERLNNLIDERANTIALRYTQALMEEVQSYMTELSSALDEELMAMHGEMQMRLSGRAFKTVEVTTDEEVLADDAGDETPAPRTKRRVESPES